MMLPTILHAEAVATLETNKKCCEKCAFRVGSRERNDPWQWMKIAEGASFGETFYCHESIPDHPDEVAGGQSRYRVCAGRAALDGKEFIHLCYPAIQREREEQLIVEVAA